MAPVSHNAAITKTPQYLGRVTTTTTYNSDSRRT